MTTIPKLSLTIDEAAEAAGVTPRTVRAWIGSGWLRAKRQSKDDAGQPTGKYLIRVADLESCLDQLPDA